MASALLANGAAKSGFLARAVAYAQRAPGAVIVTILGVHIAVWTVLPALVCANIQLDLSEGLALGKEWQLGYWKHPPLPWWMTEFLYQATGQIDSVYLLGALAGALGIYFVWLLAREVTGPTTALISALALEGLHFFNFSAVKFSHDPLQLPFWALTGWVFYRALSRRRTLDWIAAGIFLALSFWTKYSAVALAATLLLFLLLDRDARRAWSTSGPYLMAVAFLVVIGPNLWWLVTTGFQPLEHVEDSAVVAENAFEFVLFPLQWLVSQLFFLVPVIVLIGIFFYGGGLHRRKDGDAFARRYVLALAIGPFLISTVIFAAAGRLLVGRWGYPLWSFAPLALLMWFQPAIDARRLKNFARVFVVVFVAMPVAYAAIELFEPLVHTRQKATHFPGPEMAAILTKSWHDKMGRPLRYVGGVASGQGAGEFAANNMAIYSPDHPRVLVHGDLAISPWIDPADLAREGVLLVWAQSDANADLPVHLRAKFPTVQYQPPFLLPERGLFSRAQIVVNYAFVPPRP